MRGDRYTNNVGMHIRVKMVEVLSPPMMTRASGLNIVSPAAMGSNPAMVVTEVSKIGMKRFRPASTAISDRGL